jgi:hypothetical protein
MPERTLPKWLFSPDDRDSEDASKQPKVDQLIGDPPLLHLLPQLRAFLELKDPERVDRAMELLVNCQTEEELFADLQAQYGDVNVEDVEVAETRGRTKTTDRASSRSAPPPPPPAQAKPSKSEQDKDLEDFIVPDSEEEEVASGEEEDEFEIVPLDGPRRRDRSRSPKRDSAPQIVCKYGKACYRKNPVHFREFAHPWLPNNGLP